jgi:hypothetical protein
MIDVSEAASLLSFASVWMKLLPANTWEEAALPLQALMSVSKVVQRVSKTWIQILLLRSPTG